MKKWVKFWFTEVAEPFEYCVDVNTIPEILVMVGTEEVLRFKTAKGNMQAVDMRTVRMVSTRNYS